jgi:hypothetical protein
MIRKDDTMLPIHVEVWMRGKHFEQQLEPFQRLVLRFHSVFSDQLASKSTMEKALFAFRVKYYNKFIFEHANSDSAPERNFVERLKVFEEIKKPSKKDLTSLYEDLCAFRQGEWVGGHCDGVPVLGKWKPTLTECPHMYQNWYKDEVRGIQKAFGMEQNKCAVTGHKWTWKTPGVPASVVMISDTCEPTEEYVQLVEKLKQYDVVPRPEIARVAETFLDMFDEMATHPNTPVDEQLHDLFKKRIPGEFDGVVQRQALQKRAIQLESDLEEAEARANTNNSLYKECSVSLDRISKRLAQLEYTLNQYQTALRERDEVIHRWEASANATYRYR